MRIGTTSSVILLSEGFRLDASYRANEGSKVLSLLHKWKSANSLSRRLDSICNVCLPNGIFIGGRAKRHYVDDPEHGIPFLSSSDMLLASMDGVKFISKQLLALDTLLLRPGWTLISRSGTIGNTAYVRGDMDGLAGSEHIMRVVADPKKILSGYLYAFLSSIVGVSMIRQGTFGAVIDTIEPKYIASLPIPRLDPTQEEHIHQLIEQAAQLRVEANRDLHQAQDILQTNIFGNKNNNSAFHISRINRITLGLTNSSEIYSKGYRLDAGLYANAGSKSQQYLNHWRASDPQNNKLDLIGDVCLKYGIFIGSRAKRVYVDDPAHGIPFLSSSDMLLASFRHVNLISNKQPDLTKLILRQGWTLISRSGTIGNVTYVRRDMDGLAGSEHIMRVVADPIKIPSGYLFAFLNSPLGVSLIRQGTFGSVVNTIAPEFIATLPIPRLNNDQEISIHKLIEKAFDLQAKANETENQAQKILIKLLAIA